MAGVKRRSNYRKTVTDDVLYGVPELDNGRQVAIIQKSQGSNLLEVRLESGDVGLAMLPTKFRKLIWVKRGDFVVVSSGDGSIETATGDVGAVRFIIETVLYPGAIKELQKLGKWPVGFEAVGDTHAITSRGLPSADSDDGQGSDDGEQGVPVGNRNLRLGGAGRGLPSSDDDASEEEEGDSDDEDGGGSEGEDGGEHDEDQWETSTDKFGNTVRTRKESIVPPASEIRVVETTAAMEGDLATKLQQAASL